MVPVASSPSSSLERFLVRVGHPRSGRITCTATTRTRYAIGTAAKSPRAALQAVRRATVARARRQRDDQVRDQRPGDQHDDDVDARAHSVRRSPPGRSAPRSSATS